MSNAIHSLLCGAKVIDISNRVFPYTITALKDGFERARKKAGIEDFRFHDLRHSFATRLVQAGEDLLKVQRLLGHKTISMTQRYAHHSADSLRGSVEVFNRECNNSATVALKAID